MIINLLAAEKAKAKAKNGIARPKEKTDNRNAPSKAVEEVEVNRSIDPKLGPTQGVQPRAKADPAAKDVVGLPILRKDGSLIFLLTCRKGIFKIPIMSRPKITISPPPKRANKLRYRVNCWPMNPATDPKITNITLKPRIKNKPFSKILL